MNKPEYQPHDFLTALLICPLIFAMALPKAVVLLNEVYGINASTTFRSAFGYVTLCIIFLGLPSIYQMSKYRKLNIWAFLACSAICGLVSHFFVKLVFGICCMLIIDKESSIFVDSFAISIFFLFTFSVAYLSARVTKRA
jgi:hypothetical protein